MSRRVVEPLHETRGQRTRRDYHDFVTNTVHVVVWFAACNAVIIGATTFFTWGHSRAAQGLIGVGAFVVGTAAALTLPLVLFWAIAPTRQLRETRQALAEATQTLDSGDARPISVRIDRDPLWRNFNYEAYILEMHVSITNQTDSDVEISGYTMLSGRFGLAELAQNPQVRDELERTKNRRPQFGRHSIVEAHETETGWVVVAFAFDPEGQPAELPDFEVSVSGYGSFEALR